jgi:hypothetical protein
MNKKTNLPAAPIPGVDSLHTISETCATLNIGHTKCWELIGRGDLTVIRLGNRCTRIRASSINELIHSGGSGQTNRTA